MPDLDAPPATCGACTCSAPTASCGPSTLAIDSKFNCHGGSSAVADAGLRGVHAPHGRVELNDYFQQTSAQPTVSACTPAGGDATRASAGVEDRRRRLRALRQAHDVPRRERVRAPAGRRLRGPGGASSRRARRACPTGFSQKHVWEDVASDGRGCTPCTCGKASGATCATTTTLYGDTLCQSQVVTLTTDGACDTASNAQAALATVTLSGTPSCPAGGGAPTGSATTTPVLTVCCPG